MVQLDLRFPIRQLGNDGVGFAFQLTAF